MNAFWQFLRDHGTQVLGYAQGTIAALCGASVIPDPQMKYWLAAAAVLTVWRGQGNTAAIATQVVAQHMATIKSLQDASPAEPESK